MAAPPRITDILSIEPTAPMEERIREGFSPRSIAAEQLVHLRPFELDPSS